MIESIVGIRASCNKNSIVKFETFSEMTVNCEIMEQRVHNIQITDQKINIQIMAQYVLQFHFMHLQSLIERKMMEWAQDGHRTQGHIYVGHWEWHGTRTLG